MPCSKCSSLDSKEFYLSTAEDTVRLCLAAVVDMLWNARIVMSRSPITTPMKGRLNYCGVTTATISQYTLAIARNVILLI